MTTKISSVQVVMEGIGVSLSDFANNTVSAADLEAEARSREQALEAEVLARQQGDDALAQQLADTTKSLDDLQWQPISTNTDAKVGHRYLVLESVTVTLPEAVHVTVGSVIEFAKINSVSPVIQTVDDAQILVGGNSDDSVLFNIDARILFVFNGSSWEL